MRTIGNILFGGIWLALGHLIAGLLLCMTVIGIPLGIACFKMAGLAIAPFGKQIVPVGSAPTMGAGNYLPPPALG